MYSGTSFAFAVDAIMMTARANQGMPALGAQWELLAIAGCVVGGISLYVGRG